MVSHLSDEKLLALFQDYPDCGLYFTAIFCRYSGLVYSLIQYLAKAPLQVDYLFALTWRTIFYELKALKLDDMAHTNASQSLQSWLLDVTGACINQLKVPPEESVRYSMKLSSPPMWCYVENALEQLPPKFRLVLLMAHTCQWSDTLIASYLQAEGDALTAADVPNLLQDAYRLLDVYLPEDIRTIYLGPAGLLSGSNPDAIAAAHPSIASEPLPQVATG
jgi:hypothetical protein